MGQDPLKRHPMVVRGIFVPGGQGNVLQVPSKFLALHRVSHVAQVAPASVCGPANGPMLPQTDCGEAPGVVAQCGGSAMGKGWGGRRTGDRAPSPLCPCLWLCQCLAGIPTSPCRLRDQGSPKDGLCQGCSSDGNSQESGFLRPESCRVAASEEAPAESLLLTLGWAQGHAPAGQAGGLWSGQGPHTVLGWDLATSLFPHSSGTPDSAPLSTGAGPE